MNKFFKVILWIIWIIIGLFFNFGLFAVIVDSANSIDTFIFTLICSVLWWIITVFIIKSKKLKKEKITVDKEEKITNDKFTVDKAEWQYETRLNKYCSLYGKNKTDLNEEEINRIWYYSGMHISYFLTWIIKHNFLSDEYSDDKKMLEDIKKDKISCCQFLEFIDYKIARDDFKEEIIPFLDYYYQKLYINDYIKIVNNNDSKLNDFDINKYYELEKEIDERYLNFKNNKIKENVIYINNDITFKYDKQSDTYEYVCKNEEMIFWCTEVKEEYTDKIIKFSNNYHKKIDEIVDWLSRIYTDLRLESIKSCLGLPNVDLDSNEVTYYEPNFDDEHVITFYFDENLDEITDMTVDG